MVGEGMRILPDAGTDRQFGLYDATGKLLAGGSYAMCEAVRDGTLDQYIAACAAERAEKGIGLDRVLKKKGKAA